MLRSVKNLVRRSIGLRNDTDYYAQGGEDAIVSNIFSYVVPVEKGTYLDIGAYDPYKHSNTYLLYKKGWRGINVDARPGSMVAFDEARVGDVNVEAGVAAKDGSLTYYIVDDESTMNSFSRDNLERLGMLDNIDRTVEVEVLSLVSLLAKHGSSRHVDYMNIDAEGFEMEILSGLAAIDRPPSVISLEQNGVCTLDDVIASEPCRYLAGLGYIPYAKNVILADVATVFYILENALSK